MRTLSAAFRTALLAEQSDLVDVALLTVTHPALDRTIRASSHPTTLLSVDPLIYGTVSRGEQYLYVDFGFALPEDAEGKTQTIDIQLGLVSRELIALLRSTIAPARVTLEIVALDRPDDVEVVFPDFDLVSADYGVDHATLSLSLDALGDEPFPADSFTPSGFRGLF